MKSFKPVLILIISVIFCQFSFGQTSIKESIKVYGNCGQCKKKIEKNALSAGATFADWNQKNKMLIVSYDPSVSNPIKIETAIAKAGYDTRDVKASDSAYSNLDQCCQYDRKPSNSKQAK